MLQAINIITIIDGTVQGTRTIIGELPALLVDGKFKNQDENNKLANKAEEVFKEVLKNEGFNVNDENLLNKAIEDGYAYILENDTEVVLNWANKTETI